VHNPGLPTQEWQAIQKELVNARSGFATAVARGTGVVKALSRLLQALHTRGNSVNRFMHEKTHQKLDSIENKLDTLKAEFKQDVYEVISGKYVPEAEQRGTTQQQLTSRTISATFHSSAAKILKDKALVEDTTQRLAQLNLEKAEDVTQKLEAEAESRLQLLGDKQLAKESRLQKQVDVHENRKFKVAKKAEEKTKRAEEKANKAKAAVEKKIIAEAKKKAAAALKKAAEAKKKAAEAKKKAAEEDSEEEEAEEEEADEEQEAEEEEADDEQEAEEEEADEEQEAEEEEGADADSAKRRREDWVNTLKSNQELWKPWVAKLPPSVVKDLLHREEEGRPPWDESNNAYRIQLIRMMVKDGYVPGITWGSDDEDMPKASAEVVLDKAEEEQENGEEEAPAPADNATALEEGPADTPEIVTIEQLNAQLMLVDDHAFHVQKWSSVPSLRNERPGSLKNQILGDYKNLHRDSYTEFKRLCNQAGKTEAQAKNDVEQWRREQKIAAEQKEAEEIAEEAAAVDRVPRTKEEAEEQLKMLEAKADLLWDLRQQARKAKDAAARGDHFNAPDKAEVARTEQKFDKLDDRFKKVRNRIEQVELMITKFKRLPGWASRAKNLQHLNPKNFISHA
jgi:hypothetical protein